MIRKSIKTSKKSESPAEYRIGDRYITDNKIRANFNSYFSNIGGSTNKKIVSNQFI